MRSALFPDLNRVIIALAPRFEARDHAPETFRDMLAAPGIIWAGNSERTIYGDANVNHAFRAWHDMHHARGLWDFSIAGEYATLRSQVRELLSVFPRAPSLWVRALWWEVVGQGLHLQTHGTFPCDQIAFVRNGLACDILPHGMQRCVVPVCELSGPWWATT